MAVPIDSVVSEDDGDYVFVVIDGKVEKRKVSVSLEGDDYYIIESGLSESDVVVTGDSVSKLQNGNKVSLNQGS
jgi:hypothetical protein